MPFTLEESTWHWDDREANEIEAWLAARGYEMDGPTVCGSCCGYYEDEVWLNWRPGDARAFDVWATANGVCAHAVGGGIRMGHSTDG